MSSENETSQGAEVITIPAGCGLDQRMQRGDFDALLAWFRRNDVNPNAVTAERPTVIGATIDRWEVVDHSGHEFPEGLSRREHTLAEGQEWSNEGEYAKAIHHVSTPVTEPLPDDLRASLLAATRTASCPRCEGCGKLANDDEQTPWTFWAELKPPSNTAVQLGLVRPVDCFECGGAGGKA